MSSREKIHTLKLRLNAVRSDVADGGARIDREIGRLDHEIAQLQRARQARIEYKESLHELEADLLEQLLRLENKDVLRMKNLIAQINELTNE